jgi:L-aspartate oxidase
VTDFLVVGGGIAGLRAAISLAPAGRVIVLTKTEPSESNTGFAQGGIAAAIGANDSPARHAADTIRAGDGLCDESAVQVLVHQGAEYVRELLDWGVRFDRDAGGSPVLGLEAAHSVRRILHAGDATGREIARALWERVLTLDSVQTINHALVTGLLVDAGAVAGVVYFNSRGARHEVTARATLLATGGAGQVFRETTNPAVATGDGVALAYQAGARVADLEFVQFHPTALDVAGAPRFLISEAVRGEGARLVNGAGEAFMPRYHPDGDLAPRDVVARAIVRERERTAGAVFLTLAHLDIDVRRRFPTISDICRQFGLDLASDPIPIGPAAHYLMGGIDTDEWGRTSLRGLFAAGETACTGVHGANRLASNSLLEGLVFGARAAIAMQQPAQPARLKPDRVEAANTGAGGLGLGAGKEHPREARTATSPQPPASSPQDVRDLMWKDAGLFRTREGLEEAVSRLDAAYAAHSGMSAGAAATDPDAWRQFNLVTVARLIARAALRREESRGAHYRLDFPERDDARWRIHLVGQKRLT